jgi:hypothetical protein
VRWTVKCHKDLSGWTVAVNICVLSLAELATCTMLNIARGQHSDRVSLRAGLLDGGKWWC